MMNHISARRGGRGDGRSGRGSGSGGRRRNCSGSCVDKFSVIT